MAEGTQLAERGKEKITAAAAIELVKKFVKDRHKEDKANSDRYLTQARDFAGGQVEQLDKSVVDQGRRWATRLALISRTTAGSGYQASKSSQALAGLCKKVFAILGELEAVMATDTEISLFQKVDDNDYFGLSTDFNKMSVRTLTEYCDPGETLDQGAIVERLIDDLGEKVGDAVTELLSQYEIEPIIVPGKEEGAPAKNGRRRRRS
jgi:hypothetical protein